MNLNRIERIQKVLDKRQPFPAILLENVFDPHNISAVMRTCDSIGIGTVHTLYTEKPPHHLTGFRSSAGSWKWIEVIAHEDRLTCMAGLKENYGKVYAAHLSPSAIPFYTFDFTQPHAIVFGNEQKGCSEALLEQCDGCLYIPQVGMAQSLNISVACAVILYEAFRQKQEAGHYNSPQLSEEEILDLKDSWTNPKNIRQLRMRKA